MEITKKINPHFKGYIFDWGHKIYFLVGGYGSSKSYHTALKIILKLASEKRTALVVREVYDTIRDSCFALFLEIIEELGFMTVIRHTKSPMQINFKNGSKILFKGMDKPEKLKSIHDISLIWIEECAEIKYQGFKELLGRLRHPYLKLHLILTTNPVSRSNWTYTHFFKHQKIDDQRLYSDRTFALGDTYYHHSVAQDNLFLPASYKAQLQDLKTYDVDLYRVAYLGKFGVSGTLVLPQFEVIKHEDVMHAIADIPSKYFKVGMDFGFETSYNAVLRMAINHEKQYLYIYWEYYKNKMTDDETADALIEFVKTRERIKADSAEPKAIRYYQKRGFNMVAAKKTNGGTRHGRLDNTRKIKRFKKIYCSETCTNTIRELQELTYKTDKNGEIILDEFTIDPHTFSACWYGLDDYETEDTKYTLKKKDLGL